MHTDARTPLLAPTASVDPEQGLGGDVGMEAEDALPPLQAEHSGRQHSGEGEHGHSSARLQWRKAANILNLINANTPEPTPRRLGKPQGIDVKRKQPHWDYLQHDLKADVRITVVDYDADQIVAQPPMHNDDLAEFLKQPRPEWSRVRWINLQGLSWDCILALALRFDLHPLTVEDCVQVPQRVKVDFHSMHNIFCCLTLASVVIEADDPLFEAAERRASTLNRISVRQPASKDPRAHRQRFERRSHGQRRSEHGGESSASASDSEMVGGSGRPSHATRAERLAARTAPSGPTLRRLSSNRVRGIMQPFPTSAFHPPTCNDLTEVLSHISQVDTSGAPTSFRPLRKRMSGGRMSSSTGVSGAASTSTLSGPAAAAAMAAAATIGAKSSNGDRRISSLKGRTGGAARGGGSDAGADAEGLMTSLEIAAEQVYLFLMRDGTVVSMFEKDGSSVCRPVMQQLVDPASLARESQDPSYLLNQLIDAIVDVVFPLVDAYTERLHLYEDRVLIGQHNPSFTRDLHVMRGDLAALRRTMMPTQSLVTALQGHSERSGNGPSEVLITRLTRTYLGDVQDHLNTLLEDMEALQAQCVALSDLVFNLIAHHQNSSMQMLSVLSAIFLPVTFLAGVYGTNFEHLPEIKWPYGYAYFWMMCITLAVVFVTTMYKMRVMST